MCTCASEMVSSRPSSFMFTFCSTDSSIWVPSLNHVMFGVGTPAAGHDIDTLPFTTTLGFVLKRRISILAGTGKIIIESEDCQFTLSIKAAKLMMRKLLKFEGQLCKYT